MTKPKPPAIPPVIVVYGRTADGRPRAAGFGAAQAELAEKAAGTLGLNVLRIVTADQIELARRLPSGQILAAGRGIVPAVRNELFEKLLALLPAPDSGSSEQPASPVADDAAKAAAATGSEPDNTTIKFPTSDSGSSAEVDTAAEDSAATPAAVPENSAAADATAEPRPPLTSWTEIVVGDLVLARDVEHSWYEAVVLEQIGDDAFKLRFRDYPEEGIVVRRRDQLGLLPPA